jgi:hypothetical protein
MRAWVTGTCAGLAVAFPAVVVAQILDAVLDDGRPALVTVLAIAVILAGPVVGAYLAGRQDRSGLIGIAIGATCLFVIAGFGALRRGVADEDVAIWTVPALTVVGGVLGLIGALAGQAGRTRR